MRHQIEASIDEARMGAVHARLETLPFLSDIVIAGKPGAYVIHFTAANAEALRAVRHEVIVQ